MSEGNGILKIGRKGKKKFAIGDGAPFEIDVIAENNRWIRLSNEYCTEKNEDGQMVCPRNQMEARELAGWQYVQQISGTADVTLAEALEFLSVLAEEAGKLQPFFKPRSSDEPSSPEHSTLTFAR